MITRAGYDIRRCTPLEWERFMGWPDGWTEGVSDNQRYIQCGNGVVSPVATWVGTKIIELLNGGPNVT
jgi:site-specific DNA-cytosine methylase